MSASAVWQGHPYCWHLKLSTGRFYSEISQVKTCSRGFGSCNVGAGRGIKTFYQHCDPLPVLINMLVASFCPLPDGDAHSGLGDADNSGIYCVGFDGCFSIYSVFSFVYFSLIYHNSTILISQWLNNTFSRVSLWIRTKIIRTYWGSLPQIDVVLSFSLILSKEH